MSIKQYGKVLPYQVFDKLQQVNQGMIINNKRLSAALSFAKWSQEKRSEKLEQREAQPSAEQKAANELPESKRNELKLRTIKFEEAKLRTIFDMLDTEVKS